MNTYKTTARIAGVLYIMGTVAGVMSLVLAGPLLDASDTLTEISANETQMIAGALCILIMGLALAMVPVVVYPILKKHDDVLALGYVVFRGALETVTYLVSVISWLVLVPISHEYVKAEAADASSFHALGTLLVETGDQAATLTTLIFSLGALMFYTVLYRAKLVPRWLSGWGLIAVAFYIIAGLLDIFDAADPMSTGLTLMFMPMAFQEMVMALWLIVKGFNAAADEGVA
jgi:hypothetical protein